MNAKKCKALRIFADNVLKSRDEIPIRGALYSKREYTNYKGPQVVLDPNCWKGIYRQAKKSEKMKYA